MSYFSVDIETTGLDPGKSQLLSVAAVFDDLVTDVNLLPSIYIVVKREYIYGDIVAINMNQKLLEQIASDTCSIGLPSTTSFHQVGPFDKEKIIYKLLCFFRNCQPEGKFVLAGKNFGKLDYQFLKSKEFDEAIYHRFIDLGSILYDPREHKGPPSLTECKRILGVDGEVTHHALDDALDVVKCIRKRFNLAC